MRERLQKSSLMTTRNSIISSTPVMKWLIKRDKTKKITPLKYLVTPYHFNRCKIAEECIRKFRNSEKSVNNLIKKIHLQAPVSPINIMKECLTKRNGYNSPESKIYRQMLKNENFSIAIEKATGLQKLEDIRNDLKERGKKKVEYNIAQFEELLHCDLKEINKKDTFFLNKCRNNLDAVYSKRNIMCSDPFSHRYSLGMGRTNMLEKLEERKKFTNSEFENDINSNVDSQKIFKIKQEINSLLSKGKIEGLKEAKNIIKYKGRKSNAFFKFGETQKLDASPVKSDVKLRSHFIQNKIEQLLFRKRNSCKSSLNFYQTKKKF